VVGYASPTGGESSARAFLWSIANAFVNLGTLPGGDDSRAFSINENGFVVGTSTTALGGSDYRAVVWRSATISDLNTLIPADSGWTLRTATAINTAGQIVGTGVFQNQTRAFRLDPVADTTPPVISGLPAPGCAIWPPNHQLVQVAIVAAADAESGLAPGSFKVSGTSNTPGEGQIVIRADHDLFTIQLRADKGNIYTLRATARDLAGNISTKEATCTVPHDRFDPI
jgi:probable HAF family extracellular repeat protein